MSTLRTALVGQTGILKVKKSNAEQLKYRPDLGDVDLDISSELNTNTTGQFNTITGGLIQSCDIKLEPIQDLHGYDKPWVGDSGKNKLNSTLESKAQAGLIYTALGDGTYNVDGTASANGGAEFATNITLKAGSYKIVGLPSDVGSSSCYIGLMNGGSYIYTSNDASFTLSADTTFDSLKFRPGNGKQFDNVIVKPMITTDLTVTYDDFEPYANICGITGHSSVEVDVTDADSNTTQYTVALGQTVYGGNIDVVNGSGSDEYTSIDMGDMSWSLAAGGYFASSSIRGDVLPPASSQDKPDAFCECFDVTSYSDKTSDCLVIVHSQASSASYVGQVWVWCSAVSTLEDFETLVTGKKLVYRKATSTAISTTPTQINTLIGENHLDVPLEGQSLESLTYREVMAWDDVNDVVDTRLPISAIGTDESNNDTASKSYSQGDYFYKNGIAKAKTNIASGATFTLGTNYEIKTLAEILKALES